MEILQTIWTALTTPNEGLANLLLRLSAPLETIVSMLLFTTILNIKSTKRQKIIYVILLSSLSILSNLIITNPCGVILHMISWPFLIMFVFKISFLKSLIAATFPLIISSLLETFILKIIFYNVSYDIVSSVPLYRETSVLIIYLIIFLLHKLCKHLNFNISLLDTIDKKNKILLLINFVSALVTISTQFILITFFNNELPTFITILSILTLVTYFFISIYSLTKTTQLHLAKQSLEEAQLYNKSLKILHDNVRAFKHDFSNIVQAIGRICNY